MGGFSNSAKIVPSKSVEISLIGEDISCAHRRSVPDASRLSRQHSGRNTPNATQARCRNLNLRLPSATGVRYGDGVPLQEQFDDAMFNFSAGDYDTAIAKLKAILAEDPIHFDAQLALGMAYYRKGDYGAAITEGQKALSLRPIDQLAHTNLSLFYMKAGDRATAEHHGLQARIASWKSDKSKPGETQANDPDLRMAKPETSTIKSPEKFPDMPWKKK